MDHGAEKLYRDDKDEQHEQAGDDGRKTAQDRFHGIASGNLIQCFRAV